MIENENSPSQSPDDNKGFFYRLDIKPLSVQDMPELKADMVLTADMTADMILNTSPGIPKLSKTS